MAGSSPRQGTAAPHVTFELPSTQAACNREWLCRTFLPHLGSGATLPLPVLLRLLSWGTERLTALPNCLRIAPDRTAPCLVIGPLRGHTDVARTLAITLAKNPTACVVFLGDYIDGGQYSVEALCLGLATLVSLPPGRVALLRGRHEQLFPVPPRWTGTVEARFDDDLRWRCVQYVAQGHLRDSRGAQSQSATETEAQLMREVEALLRSAFDAMPLAAVVHQRYFCASGGPTSAASLVTDIDELDRSKGFGEEGAGGVIDLVASDAADEDEEALAVKEGFDYARNQECGAGAVYTFNAACEFLRANDLFCIIKGSSMPLHAHPPLVSSAGRPSNGRYSTFDPGYRVYRQTPLALPSSIALFSAPRLAGSAQNLGAVAWITEDVLSLHQFDAPARRGVQLPGDFNRSAFSWSMPLITKLIVDAVRCMVEVLDTPGEVDSVVQLPADDPGRFVSARDAEDARRRIGAPPGPLDDVEGKLRRFRRLCKHAQRMPQGLDVLAIRKAAAAATVTPPRSPPPPGLSEVMPVA